MASKCRRNVMWTYRGYCRNGLFYHLLALLNIFFLLPALPGGAFAGTVKNGATTYGSFHGAYAAASSGAVLKSEAMTYPEGLLLNRTIALTIQGGYDSIFGVATGFTTINGPLIVGAGSVIVGNLIIAGSNATVFVPNVVGHCQPLKRTLVQPEF
jgi:hypothetical protein